MSEENYLIGQTTSDGWTVERYMTSGAYGDVYVVRRRDRKSGIMKVEIPRYASIRYEGHVLKSIHHLNGFPNVYTRGRIQGRPMFVMQHLGESVESMMLSHRFTVTDILKIGIQLVARLRDMHARNLLHRDVHVGNILTGNPIEGDSGTIYLIDFGETGHVDGPVPDRIHGDLHFASSASLRMDRYGRKDDLESLVYVLVYLFRRHLPWSKYKMSVYSDSYVIRGVLGMRSTMTASSICAGLPSSITGILIDVQRKRRIDIPEYGGYIRAMRFSLHSTGASENDTFSWE